MRDIEHDGAAEQKCWLATVFYPVFFALLFLLKKNHGGSVLLIHDGQHSV